jgi:hypothetical protein
MVPTFDRAVGQKRRISLFIALLERKIKSKVAICQPDLAFKKSSVLLHGVTGLPDLSLFSVEHKDKLICFFAAVTQLAALRCITQLEQPQQCKGPRPLL